MLQGAFEKLHLSGRACNRILRVARTAADLAGKEQIEEEEIAEAIGIEVLTNIHGNRGINDEREHKNI